MTVPECISKAIREVIFNKHFPLSLCLSFFKAVPYMRTRSLVSGLLAVIAMANLSYHMPSSGHVDRKRYVELAILDTNNGWVDSVYNSLSRDERIAQLLMIPAYSNRNRQHTEEVSRIIRKYKPGGIVFFQGGPKRQAWMTNEFQAVAQTPLLIAIDAEWGPGMRLDSTLSYPKQMMLGAISSDSLIWQMGYDIAGQLKRIGVHMNFAPVVDINSNPANPVINSRSFGENKLKVARKGVMYMRGMQDNNILCTAKHFPGHGDTDTDSHYELPVVRHSYERLREVELHPFAECISNGISGIMVSHLLLPQLDTQTGLPASMSPEIITGLLRNKMDFKGLIVTDALNMQGVAGYGQPGELEARALVAGNDILVMPSDVPKTISAVRREIRRGNIEWSDIEEKCKKILAAKKWVGLSQYRPVDMEGLDHDLHLPEYELTRSRLTESALTLLSNKNDLLPLQRLDTIRIASLSIGGPDTLNEFQQYLSLYTDVKHFHLGMDAADKDYQLISNVLHDYNLLIVSIHGTFLQRTGNYGVSKDAIRCVRGLADSVRLVLTVFSNPYLLQQFEDPSLYDAMIIGYEDSELSQAFTAQLIFGGIASAGRLPVSSGKNFKEDGGLSTNSCSRFKYSLPIEAGLNADTLRLIDSLVLDAISEEAIPGCQVLVARNGVVVYHKAFGYHSYLKRQAVKLEDIYDLASITKITSTLPSIMKLRDEGRLSVDDTLGSYLPGIDTTNKSGLVIKEILSHKAGLKAWIPFYLSTLETMNPKESLISTKYTVKHPIRLGDATYVNRNVKYIEGIYSREYSQDYPIQVADYLYMNRDYRDTVFRKIYESELLDEKEYVYSDLGLYLLMQVVEEMTDSSLYSYAYHNFYKHLGATTLGFLPLNRFPVSRIVPTENDMVFRRQLLRGHVHDMGAAMLGGICGHAGLFSNANDLAKMMQMYLQKGYYGGRRYLSEETVQYFNTCHYCDEGIRRGLGFDKPDPYPDPEKGSNACDSASVESFGHYGFTGTMTWADPVSGILYVFLSNRVHPDQDNIKLSEMNIRTGVQQVIYNAITEQ